MKGFTLIDAIISASVLIVFCCSAVFLMRLSMLSSAKNEKVFTNLCSAQQRLEELRTVPYGSLTGDARTAVTETEAGLKTIGVNIDGISLFTVRSAY